MVRESPPDSVVLRVEELRRAVRDADERYFQRDDPLLSDLEYDQLKDELITLEDRWPTLRTPDSPTQTVGFRGSTQFAEVRHREPMLSLEKVTTVEEFVAWRRSMEEFDAGADFAPRFTV